MRHGSRPVIARAHYLGYGVRLGVSGKNSHSKQRLFVWSFLCRPGRRAVDQGVTPASFRTRASGGTSRSLPVTRCHCRCVEGIQRTPDPTDFLPPPPLFYRVSTGPTPLGSPKGSLQPCLSGAASRRPKVGGVGASGRAGSSSESFRMDT